MNDIGWTDAEIRESREKNNELNNAYKHGYDQARKEFERPRGEWKETGYETGSLGITYRQTQCSNCGWEHALPMLWNFCPNCGADMKGGADKDPKEVVACVNDKVCKCCGTCKYEHISELEEPCLSCGDEHDPVSGRWYSGWYKKWEAKDDTV